MATMKDVALRAEVSVTTVSATINGTAPVSEELRKRVYEAIEAVGYQPDPIARHLRSGKSTTIGLVIPDISIPCSAQLAKIMQKTLSGYGYGLLLSGNDDDPEQELKDIDMFNAHRVAGLIVMPTSRGENYLARISHVIRTPAVLVDRTLPGSRFNSVTDDNELGAQLLTKYLIKLGHRDIAFLAGRDGISPSDERLAGFQKVMAKEGLPVREELVYRSVYKTDQAFAAIQQLMTLPKPPTAILSINIAQTRGIMMGLKNMNLRAPDDISVASFDGFHLSDGWDPGITSLSQDIEQISARAVQLLLQDIADNRSGNDPAQTIRVPPRLFIRESCKAI